MICDHLLCQNLVYYALKCAFVELKLLLSVQCKFGPYLLALLFDHCVKILEGINRFMLGLDLHYDQTGELFELGDDTARASVYLVLLFLIRLVITERRGLSRGGTICVDARHMRVYLKT
jgi:hypothetical protein